MWRSPGELRFVGSHYPLPISWRALLLFYPSLLATIYFCPMSYLCISVYFKVPARGAWSRVLGLGGVGGLGSRTRFPGLFPGPLRPLASPLRVPGKKQKKKKKIFCAVASKMAARSPIFRRVATVHRARTEVIRDFGPSALWVSGLNKSISSALKRPRNIIFQDSG